MSWKSIVTAGVLGVIASPVFAVPQLSVTSGGLNSNGNWIWNVNITPTAAGTPLAAELGFRESVAGSQLLVATRNAVTWDTENPGVDIFGTNTSGDWEVHTDVDPTAVVNMRPVGLQTNVATDEIFSALGSVDLVAGTAVNYMTITTKGPTTASPTSSMQVLGKHGAGGTSGRIAEMTGATATNYSNFAGTATRTAFGGDVNVDGNVNFNDVLAFSPNFNKATTNGWAAGDFDGNGTTNFNDVLVMSPNFNKAGGVNTPLNVNGVAGGASLGSGSSVPEPSSIAIAGLALLTGLGFMIRNRQ